MNYNVIPLIVIGFLTLIFRKKIKSFLLKFYPGKYPVGMPNWIADFNTIIVPIFLIAYGGLRLIGII